MQATTAEMAVANDSHACIHESVKATTQQRERLIQALDASTDADKHVQEQTEYSYEHNMR